MLTFSAPVTPTGAPGITRQWMRDDGDGFVPFGVGGPSQPVNIPTNATASIIRIRLRATITVDGRESDPAYSEIATIRVVPANCTAACGCTGVCAPNCSCATPLLPCCDDGCICDGSCATVNCSCVYNFTDGGRSYIRCGVGFQRIIDNIVAGSAWPDEIRLVASIEIDSTFSDSFANRLYGDGHTITINSNGGIFASILTMGVVENLSIIANIPGGDIAGAVTNRNYGQIINVHVISGSISGNTVGGIVGINFGELHNNRVESGVIIEGQGTGPRVGRIFGHNYNINPDHVTGNYPSINQTMALLCLAAEPVAEPMPEPEDDGIHIKKPEEGEPEDDEPEDETPEDGDEPDTDEPDTDEPDTDEPKEDESKYNSPYYYGPVEDKFDLELY